MAIVVNTNIAALNAAGNLNKSQGILAKSMQRLSSGLRINSAKDDAAGLAIATRMSAQIRGLNQAARNANDGISLAQTAEGALSEHANLLQRIRELAVQSANSTNTGTDRASLQAEVNQLQSELNRIATKTSFNGLKILDGTFANQTFQIGAEANQTISVSIASVQNDDIGRYSFAGANAHESQGTGSTSVAHDTALGAGHTNTIAGQTLTINGKASATVTVTAGDTAQSVAQGINDEAATTGVNATATTTATLSNLSAAGNLSFSISSGGTLAAISVTGVATADLSSVADAINVESGKTQVSASWDATTNVITLTQSDGKDIIVEGFTNSGSGHIHFIGSAETTGVQLTHGGNDSSRASGEVELYSTSSFSATSSVLDTAGSIFDSGAAIAHDTVSDIDISDAAGAQTAISIVDAAMDSISSTRGDLGALQNRFESTIANLNSVAENVTAARSRIMDADIAMETAEMTKASILQQAGVAILAQANQTPQLALSLLR